ncbi:MAG TPA: hypothetical protein VGD61_18375 [Pyrinomonadaceae bacterium]
MKMQRIATALTVINLALLVFLLAQAYRTQAHEAAPVLRGRGLEIVDDQGRIRAEILVHGPETVNGKTYPETVLFRMATAQRAPLMKLTVSEDGSALGLSDDSAPGGVELFANRNKGNFVKIVNSEGREQTLKP